MKNLFLTAVFLLFSFGVFAQSADASFVEKQFPGNAKAAKVAEKAIAKNLNDKTSATRTTWLANRVRDNWFISVEGGANLLIAERVKNFPFADNLDFPNKLSFGGALGKWFSPVWGLRISGGTGTVESFNFARTGTFATGGAKSSRYTNDGTLFLNNGNNHQFTYTNVTLDFMVNLKHLLMAYNPKGFFNPVVYAGVGTVRTWGSATDNIVKDILTLWQGVNQAKGIDGIQNIAVKGGLQLNFRIADPIQLYLAAEGLLVPDNFNHLAYGRALEGVASARLGLTYRFGFRHFIKAEFCDQSLIDALIRENNELRKRPVSCPPAPTCPPCPEPKTVVEQGTQVVETVQLAPVFFLINSSTVRDSELPKVASAAAYLNNNPNAKLELKGYADKKTGNPTYNMQISKRRAESVAKMLTDKFGINKSRLTVTAKGDTEQPFTKNEENRVTIFVK